MNTFSLGGRSQEALRVATGVGADCSPTPPAAAECNLFTTDTGEPGAGRVV